jgi:putative hydrolase of the HAD superfamily
VTAPAAPRALILDYGDVLSRPQRADSVQAMAARLGVTPGAFGAAYWAHRRAYDGGLPAADYWRRVLDTLAWAGPAAEVPATVDWLIATDVASWVDYRQAVWAIARWFRATGRRTAFLSNGVPEVVARLRAERALDSAFDVVVVSSEVGLTKPDPRIFELCLARLGVAPGEALFVDDRPENVEAAAQLGIRTLHFVGDDAVERLRALL